ncbi:hypothetical protein [Mycolicibacterium chubuense]|uniref:hypothetical protein n=1 Tax=Mycolicibacterium chubuense TaxID=1800 RepID=UPI001300FDA0|nr:hypothetical protein [Mycolicibacterium chubuense]
MSFNASRLWCWLAVCTLALCGCGAGTSAPAATKTVTVIVTPQPVSVVAPIKLPAGSVVYNRSVDEHSGAWEDIWKVPHSGPEAMTKSQLIDFLQAELPGGRPYEAGSSHLEWCKGGESYWSWQKAGDGPDQPDIIDRLSVLVVADNYVEIRRDAREPFDCKS